ncbi:MAG TPA: hypothetical protein VGE29_20620, partial [Prosthecobacter sp.]
PFWLGVLMAGCLGIPVVVASSPPAQSGAGSADLVDRLVAESQQHAVVRKVQKGSPLYQAENFAVELASDVSLFNEWMLKIILAYAAEGDFDNALYLTRRLPGTGPGEAYASLALLQARRGQREQAEAHLHLALEQLGRASGLRAESLRSACALVMRHLGKEKEAIQLEAQLGKLELLSHMSRLQEDALTPPLTLLDAKRQLVGLMEKNEDERHARFLLACAKRQFKANGPSLAVPYLEEIGSMAMERGLPSAQHVLLDLAQVAWTGGQAQIARKSMNLFLKCCESYSSNVEWKAIFTAEAVGVLLDWDSRAEAESWLKVAENAAPHVFIMDAPDAVLAIARQKERMEGVGAADKVLETAGKMARAIQHPRAKAEVAVRICLYCASASREMPESVLKLLQPAEGEVEISK